MADLLMFLDKQVGKGKYLVASRQITASVRCRKHRKNWARMRNDYRAGRFSMLLKFIFERSTTPAKTPIRKLDGSRLFPILGSI